MKLVVFPGMMLLLIKQLSLILLLLFSKAIFLKTPPKVPKVIILIFLTSLTLFVYNFLGYRFLPPVPLGINPGYNTGSLTILYRDATVFTYFSSVIIGTLLAYDLRVAMKRFKEQTNQSKAFVRYLTFYVSIIVFNFLFLIITQKYYKGQSSAETFTIISRMLLIVEFLFPFVIPGFLTSITKLNFSKLTGSSLAHENKALSHLTQVITSQKLFLQPDFSLAKMQFHSNVGAEAIRNAIRASHFDNFKAFLNHHRVVHAVALIDGGYLAKHTINSLSVDSGFKSPVTFFRAFKDKKKQTPLAYATQNG
jgi:AraC-like DNA-binding protein